MPELLRLKTKDWEMSLWSNDLATKVNTFKKTLKRHNKTSISSRILFSKKLNVEIFQPSTSSWLSIHETTTVESEFPFFFENTQYQFEWIFFDKTVISAVIAHKLININNSFRFSAPRGQNDLPRMLGSINTRNDVGWLKLPIIFTSQSGIENNISISFEVIPTKMDMESDLVSMYKEIDSKYPLWRFNLATKTEQSTSQGNKIGHFPLLWLAHFESLRQKMLLGLKVITNNPHSNLKNKNRRIHAEKLKGKLSNKQIENLIEDVQQGITNKSYRHTKKFLSLDTPENRFIKKIVFITKNRLTDFHKKLIELNSTPENQQISPLFIKAIKNWQEEFSRIENQTFLSEISHDSDSEIATMVLQQKTGYNTVFKIWQVLKFYLDMFDSQAQVSMKSISEIYELWCFLEIRDILLNTLSFEESIQNKNYLTLKDLEYKMKDGFGGAFEFERNDGIKIRLAHEPVFTKFTIPVRTFWSTQKPDLLMEVTLSNNKKYLWIFDAKYRVDSNNHLDLNSSELDYVPEDSINQMHRYRDSLINFSEYSSSQASPNLSRPVFGAFALYPGFFDQESTTNPYNDSIEKVGVGAFALLPSTEFRCANKWLKDYLIKQIGLPNQSHNHNFVSEEIALQSPSQISLTGSSQNFYKNLILVSLIDPIDEKNLLSLMISDDGNSGTYRVSTKLFKDRSHEYIIRELKFIAFVERGILNPSKTAINTIWPINSVQLRGTFLNNSEKFNEEEFSDSFWVIELGQKLTLRNSIENVSFKNSSQVIKFTTLELIEQVRESSHIPEVYIGRIADCSHKNLE